MSNTIKVTFLGDESDLDRATSSAERSTSRLGGTLKKVGAAAAVGLAAGLVVGGKALWDAGQKAGDLNETISKTNQIFGSAEGRNLEKWAKGAAVSLGQSQQTALDAAATFGVFGKAAGMSGKDLGKFAKQNTELATDMASFHNTSPEEAIEAIGAAFRGEAEPMRKYGVLLDDASMRQQALKMGLVKTTKEALTPQQKVLTAQALIMKQTSDAQGDFGRTSGGLANQQKILKAQFEDLQVTVGNKVTPVMTNLMTWMNTDGVPHAKRFGAGLMDAGRALGKVARFASEHKTALTALAAAIAAVVVVTQLHTAVMAIQAGGGMVAMIRSTKIITSLTRAWAAVQWLLNAALRANPIGIVITILAALAIGLTAAYRKSETFRTIVNGAFRAIAAVGKWLWENALRPAFNGMKTALSAVGKAGIWLWNNALQPAFRAIANGLAFVMRGWATMLRALGKVPGFGWATAAANAMQGAANKAQAVANNLNKIRSKKVTVSVHTRYSYSGLRAPGGSGPTRNGEIGTNARGTDNWRGGATWVGEEGPEIIDLPRGARVTPHRQSMARAAGGAPVVINFHGLVTDPRATAREIARLLREEKLLSGRELGIS